MGFVVGLHAVFVYLGAAAGAVGKAARPADAPAGTGHALDEIGVQQVFAFFEESDAALLDAVAGGGLQLEIGAAVLPDALCHRFRQTAAAGKDAPEVGGFIQHALLQCGDVDLPAVKQRLQLLEGHGGVHVGAHLRLLGFALFGGAGADEYHLRRFVTLLEVAGDGCHGGKIVGNVGLHFREGLFDVADEPGAAGAGQKALFHQLTAFGIRYHIGAERCFRHRIKAQLLEPGDHLPQPGIGELAGDGGCNHGVDMVFAVVLAFFDHVDDIEDVGFIGDGAEGTLIDARPAGDAGIVIDGRRLVLVHGDGLYLAGVFTGALAVHNGGIGADTGAGAAVHALGFIDVRNVVMEGDGALGTDVLAAAGQTPAAGIGHLVAAHGAFVAGDIDDLDDVGVLLIAAHGHPYPFA